MDGKYFIFFNPFSPTCIKHLCAEKFPSIFLFSYRWRYLRGREKIVVLQQLDTKPKLFSINVMRIKTSFSFIQRYTIVMHWHNNSTFTIKVFTYKKNSNVIWIKVSKHFRAVFYASGTKHLQFQNVLDVSVPVESAIENEFFPVVLSICHGDISAFHLEILDLWVKGITNS